MKAFWGEQHLFNPFHLQVGLTLLVSSAASGLYRQAFWMKHWGHMCLKRTVIWSTSSKIQKLDLGPIQKGKHKSLVKTAEKYKDKAGKDRYKGTGKALKGTQFVDCVGSFTCRLCCVQCVGDLLKALVSSKWSWFSAFSTCFDCI